MILLGRVRAWFVEQIAVGGHIPIVQRVAAGESLEDILPELPIAPLVYDDARARSQQALEIFERLGDRRGAMASIIAMAYLSWAPDIHLGSGSARHIEEIRRLDVDGEGVHERERARGVRGADALRRARVRAREGRSPTSRSRAARRPTAHAREMGDRSLEFLAAGGTAMAYLDLGEVGRRRRRGSSAAAAVAVGAPDAAARPPLETWRGMADAAAGDAAGMRTHLERAVQLATEQGLPAARCEALARLAMEAVAARAPRRKDDELLDAAERAATEAAELAALAARPPAMGGGGRRGARARRARARPHATRPPTTRAIGVGGAAGGAARGPAPGRPVPVGERARGGRTPEWEELRPTCS